MNTVVTAINEGPFRATESRVDKPPLGFVCHIVDLYWGELCALTGNVLPRKAYGVHRWPTPCAIQPGGRVGTRGVG
jgi:hypothetical protein